MKKLVSLISVLSAAAAFAAAEPQVACLSFATQGPDKYADGTEVLKGECYALVWSADGVFEGIKADGTCVDANDRVLYVATTDAAGKLTGKEVQIGADVKFGETLALDGQFAIYLLDTRKYGEDGKVASVGKANPVNYAQVAVAEFKTTATIDNAVKVEEGVAIASTASTPLPEGEPTTPVIKNFEVGAETVTLTVAGTSQFATYAAVAGTTPLATGITGAPKAGNGEITLIVAKPVGNTGFFRIIRK